MSRPEDRVPDLSFHLALQSSPARGGASLALSVGGIGLRLDGLSEERLPALERRYGIFCSAARAREARPDLQVTVSRADLPGFLTVRRPSEMYRVDTRWEGSTLMACSYEWAGWMDASRRKGGLALAAQAFESARAFDRSVENFLRVVFAHLIVARGGFLLHSAGLVRGGSAFVFFGPSGSGKTTVTGLTPEATVLSDDLTMVREGPDGGFRACSVPFRGLFAPEPSTDASWPVAGFFRLVQDKVDRLVEVRGARAVGELVGSLPFVTERPEIAADVMDVVAAAARKAPVFRLHFRKDRTFWQVIEARCPAVDGFSAPRGIKP